MHPKRKHITSLETKRFPTPISVGRKEKGGKQKGQREMFRQDNQGKGRKSLSGGGGERRRRGTTGGCEPGKKWQSAWTYGSVGGLVSQGDKHDGEA